MDTTKKGTRENRIRQRAYAIWQKAGAPDGQHQEHWAKACEEIDEEDGQIEVHSEAVSPAALPTAEEFATPAEKEPMTTVTPANGAMAPSASRRKPSASDGRLARGARA